MPRHLNDVESKLFVKVEDSKHIEVMRDVKGGWLVASLYACYWGKYVLLLVFFLCQHQNDVES